MNNKLTILSVIIAHLCVITGLVLVGGCRSSTGMEGTPNRHAFTGFPGESGASGYEASSATSIKQSAPAAQPVVATNPPSAVNEPAGAPGTESAPAAVAVTETTPPPAEPTTAPVAPVGTGRTYTVKPNESLWIIAKREGVSIDDIVAANHLSKNAILRPGQKLTIPAASGHKSSSASSAHSAPKKEIAVSGDTYTVKSGDAISIIARKLGTTSTKLREANGLKGDTIRVGQKLAIPADAKNKSAGAAVSSTGTKKAAPEAVSATEVKKTASTASVAPATTGGLRDVPLMGDAGAGAPAAVPAETAPAPEPVEATPVAK